MGQLPLDISLPPSYLEEDFLVAKCNRDAWAALEQWDREQIPCALVKGPTASGKTHLANIWAARNNANIINAASLNTNSEPQSLFENSTNLAVENCENIANEQFLFHLLNFMRNNSQYRMVLTANVDACWNSFTLPDLRSRLQALPQATIKQPDDVLLTALLVKSFQDRQIDISHISISYLLPRIERSFEGLRKIIDALDKHAIAKKRPITRALIQEVLTKH